MRRVRFLLSAWLIRLATQMMPRDARPKRENEPRVDEFFCVAGGNGHWMAVTPGGGYGRRQVLVWHAGSVGTCAALARRVIDAAEKDFGPGIELGGCGNCYWFVRDLDYCNLPATDVVDDRR